MVGIDHRDGGLELDPARRQICEPQRISHSTRPSFLLAMTSALDLRSRARGTLLGVLVGDALGMGYEGLPPAEVPEKIVMRDVRLGRGTYTDDTQMTMALAESLLRCNLVDEDDLGTSFAAADDPERGYGAGTTHVLDLIRHGQTPAKAARLVFNGRGSVGNGAAMRVAPVAIRFHDDSVLLDAQARSSARVTHAHRVGIDATAVQAAAVAASLNGEEPLAAATAAAQTDELAAADLLVRGGGAAGDPGRR